MFGNIPKSPHIYHFITYCFTLIGCGAVITGLGPLLPFFGAQYHQDATSYSFLFLARAGGYLIGSLLSKIWEKLFTFHQIIFYSCVLMAIMLLFFSFIPILSYKTLFIFITGIMNSQLDIFINMSIIEEQKNNQLDFWLQVSHGAFGIGGLIGPLFVFWLGFHSFIAISIIFLLVAAPYCFLKSPDVEKREISEQLIKSEQSIPVEKRLTTLPKLLICFMFLLMVGKQTAFGGLISSYAYIGNISSKEMSSLLGSLYWLSMTLFRFIFSCFSGSPSKKLFYFILGSIIFSSLSLVIIKYLSGEIGVIFSSAILGMMCSVLFPLLLSMPKQFGYDLTPSQNSDFMICAALGEGILAVITGYLMNFFGIDMLFYSLIGINVFLLLAYYIVEYLLESEKKEEESKSIDKIIQERETNINE